MINKANRNIIEQYNIKHKKQNKMGIVNYAYYENNIIQNKNYNIRF